MRVQSFRAAIIAAVAAGYLVLPANAETVVLPPAHGQFDYQLGGAYPPEKHVAIVVRDRQSAPARDTYNICYVNAFQTQPADAGWWTSNHPDLLVRKNGRLVADPKWPDEYLLDTSTESKRAALIDIVGPWFDKCAADGFKAIDADNLDSWTRSHGVLSEAGNAAFAKLLVTRAHAANLAIAQKNTSSLASKGRSRIGFDFAIVEECEVWSECTVYTDAYHDQVYEIEYNDNNRNADGKPVAPPSFFKAACAARGSKISIIYRDRLLVPSNSPGYEYRVCK